MANNEQRYNFTLAFNADTRSAKREMTSLVEEINKLTKNTLSRHISFGNVKEEAQQAAREVNKFSSILANAVNVDTGKLDLSKLNKSLKASNTDLTKMAKQFGALGNEGIKAFSNVVRQINAAEVPLRKTNAMVDKLWQSLKNTFTWQVSSSALNAFTGAISGAYTYAKNLNKSLNDIRIVTGYSADQMAKFAKEANKAARELSATTQEYTKASLIYYQQGLNESEVAERTKITVQMAKVAGDSASEVSQQLTAVWNNFAKGGENLTKFADSMTALGAATASSTKEISDGLEKFASVADTVGLSFDYAAAALATITATTRASADTVGTSLKTLFARIQDLEMGKTLDDGTTLGKYSQTLKAVGIDIKDANGELKNMDTILNEMGVKWKTLAKDEQVALAQGVAGTREYAQLVALMDNWDFMKKNLETSKNAAGTLAEQAKIYEESWRAASDRVKAAAEGLFDDLINDDFFIDLLNGAEKLLDVVKSLVQSLGGVEGVLATISTYVLTIARTKIADELKRITGPSQKTKEMEAMNTKKEANNAFKTILGKSGSQEDKIRADNYKRIYEIQERLYGSAKDLSEEQIRTAQAELDQYQILTDIVAEKAKAVDLSSKEAKYAKEQLRLEIDIQKKQNKIKQSETEEKGALSAELKAAYDKGGSLNRTGKAFSPEDIVSLNQLREKSGFRSLSEREIESLQRQTSDDKRIAELKGKATLTVEESAELEQLKKSTQAAYLATINALKQDFRTEAENLGKEAEKIAQEIAEGLNLDNKSAEEIIKSYEEVSKKLAKVTWAVGSADGIDQDAFNALDDDIKKDIAKHAGVLTADLFGLDKTNQLTNQQRDQIAAAIEKIREEHITGISKDTGIDVDRVRQATDAIDEQSEAMVNLANKEKGLEKIGKDVADGMDENLKVTASWQDAIVSAAGAVTSLVSAWQTLGGIWDTFNDPDLTAWEKITSIFMALGTAIPALVLAWKNLTEAEAKIKETIVTGLNTMASRANQKAKENEGKTIKDNLKNSFSNVGKGWKNRFNEKAFQSSSRYKFEGMHFGEETYQDVDTGELMTKNIAKQRASSEALKGLSSLLKSGGYIAAGIAVAVAGTKLAIDQYNKHANAAKEAAERSREAAMAYEDASQDYENLKSSIASYQEAQDGISKLIKGTDEYEEAVLKANEETMKLLDLYEELEYEIGSDGLIVINEESLEKAKKDQLEILKEAQRVKQITERNQKTKESESRLVDFARKELNSSQGGWGAVGNTAAATGIGAGAGALLGAGLGIFLGPLGMALGAKIGAVAGAAISGIVSGVVGVSSQEEQEALDKLANVYAESGNSKFTKENFEKLLREELKLEDEALINSLIKNRESTLKLAKEMAENNKLQNQENAVRIQDKYKGTMEKSGLTEELQKTASSLTAGLLTSKVQELYSQKYEDQLFGMSDATIQRMYAEKMGYSVSATENMSGNKAKYYDKDGAEVGVIGDDVARMYLAELAALEELEPGLKLVSQRLKELSKSTEVADKALLNFLKNKNLSEVSQEEYDAIKEKIDSDSSGELSAEEVKQYIKDSFNNGQEITAEVAHAYGYTTPEEMYRVISEKIVGYDETRDAVDDSYTLYTQKVLENFSEEAKNKMSNVELGVMGQQINAALLHSGEEGAEIVTKFYKQAGIEANELAQGLNKIDWDSVTPEELSKQLKEAGVSTVYTKEQSIELIDIMRKTAEQGIENLSEKIKGLNNLLTVKFGDTISEEEFGALSTTLQSYFTLMADGTRKLTGDALDFYQTVRSEKKENFSKQIEVNLDQLKDYDKFLSVSGSINKELSEKLPSYEDYLKQKLGDFFTEDSIRVVEENGETYLVEDVLQTQDNLEWFGENWDHNTQEYKYTLYDTKKNPEDAVSEEKSVYRTESAYLKNLKSGSAQLSTEDQDLVSNWLTLLSTTEFASSDENLSKLYDWRNKLEQNTLTIGEVYDEIQQAVNQYDAATEENIQKNQELLKQEIQQLYQYQMAEAENAQEREKIFQEASEVDKAIASQAYATSAYQAIQEERWEGIDVEGVGDYATHLTNIAKDSEIISDTMTAEAAEEVALYTTKMNQGLEKLFNNSENWISVLESSDEASQEFGEALEGLTDAMSDLLGVSEDFIDKDFIIEHLEEIREASTGSAKAIDKLKESLAKNILINIVGVDKFEEVNTTIQGLHNALAAMDTEIKIGATLDDGDFIAAANALVQRTGASVEEAQAYFNSLGYEPTFVTHEIEQPLQGIKTQTSDVQIDEASYTDSSGNKKTYPYIKSMVTTETPFTSDEKRKIQVPTLSSDGTPQIKYLTKTTSGAMSNVSSKNSGGGQSVKVKKPSIVKRYKRTDDQLADVQRELDAASKSADRLWGPDRIAEIQKMNQALETQIKLLRDERAEAEYHLKEDKEALINTVKKSAGITITNKDFDENGNLINYEEITTKLYRELEAAIGNDALTASIQKRIDEVKDAINQYDETNQKIKDNEDAQKEAWYQIQDNNLEELNTQLEFKIELKDSELEKIEFQLERLRNKLFTDVEEYSKLLIGKQEPLNRQTEISQNINDLLEKGRQGLISQDGFLKAMASNQSTVIDNIKTWEEYRETLRNWYGDTLKKATEEISMFTSEMESLNSVLDHYNNILDLVGKKDDFGAKRTILAAQAELAKDRIANSKQIYESQVTEADKWFEEMSKHAIGTEQYETAKANWQAAQEVVNKAQSETLEGTIAWGEAMKATLENDFVEMAKIMEDSLTGGISFDELMTSMERRGSLQEEYLTTTNQIYETTKLMRTAQKVIDESTNQVAKQKLNNFVKETQQLQKQGKLSQYELDIQQAKYDLLLAEIALQEAQNAKSTVRLQRDSEGNFGYVYTADQNEIADAQQKLDDANNVLYNKALEGANDYNQKYFETMRDAQDAITTLTQAYMDGEIASWDDYERQRVEIVEYYGEKLQQYSELEAYALAADTRVINDAWTQDFEDTKVSVSDWKDSVNNYFTGAKTGLQEWSNVCSTVLEETNLDDLKDEVGKVTEKNQALVDVLMGKDGEGGLVNALMDEAAKISNLVLTSYPEWETAIDGVIKEYEGLLTAITNAKTEAANFPKLPEGWDKFVGTYSPPPDDDSNKNGDTFSGTEESGNLVVFSGKVQQKTTLDIMKESDGFIAKRLNLNTGDQVNFGQTENERQEMWVNGELAGWVRREKLGDVIAKLAGFDTGGYTGDWGPEGKLAMLHQKELVLNQQDTSNLLAAVDMLRAILNTIDIHALNSQLGGLLTSPSFHHDTNNVLEQNVKIEASFPGVQDRHELEEAFNNLINKASQYANRK